MKLAIGLLVFAVSRLVSVQTSSTTIAFDNTDYNFGTVKEGKTITHTFTFKNTGKTDYIIKEVNASCDCMVPTLPKGPVKPGATGTIVVVFNTSGQAKAKRMSSKSVTITANTIPDQTSLYMQGYVLPKR